MEFNDGAPRLGFEAPARVRSLRTDRWRMTIYRDEDWGELYDLETDPRETRNLWDAPEHAETRAALVLRLAHELTHQMDEAPRAQRMA